MEPKRTHALPCARTDQLIIQEVPDELLIYDLDSHKAHCLNKTSALVWKHCDGQTTIRAVARLIEQEVNMPVGDDLVWLALKQLEKFNLLQSPVSKPKGVSRRDLILKYAPAALAVPLILSISSPTAAQAGSNNPCVANPGALGCPCTFDRDCDESNCDGGTCAPSL